MTVVQDSQFIVGQLIRVTAKEARYLERTVGRLRALTIDISWVESLESWYESGARKAGAQYEDGALHGASINWREDGQVQGQVVFHRCTLQSGDDKTPASAQ